MRWPFARRLTLDRYATQVPLGKHVLLAKTFAAWHRALQQRRAKDEEIRLVREALATARERPQVKRAMWRLKPDDPTYSSGIDVHVINRAVSTGGRAGCSISEAEWRNTKEGRAETRAREAQTARTTRVAATREQHVPCLSTTEEPPPDLTAEELPPAPMLPPPASQLETPTEEMTALPTVLPGLGEAAPLPPPKEELASLLLLGAAPSLPPPKRGSFISASWIGGPSRLRLGARHSASMVPAIGFQKQPNFQKQPDLHLASPSTPHISSPSSDSHSDGSESCERRPTGRSSETVPTRRPATAAVSRKLAMDVLEDEWRMGHTDAYIARPDRRDDCFFYIANGKGSFQKSDGPGRQKRNSDKTDGPASGDRWTVSDAWAPSNSYMGPAGRGAFPFPTDGRLLRSCIRSRKGLLIGVSDRRKDWPKEGPGRWRGRVAAGSTSLPAGFHPPPDDSWLRPIMV